jgi:hypothetical protein
VIFSNPQYDHAHLVARIYSGTSFIKKFILKYSKDRCSIRHLAWLQFHQGRKAGTQSKIRNIKVAHRHCLS